MARAELVARMCYAEYLERERTSATKQGPLHTSFRLGPGAGQLVLTQPDGVTDGGFLLDVQPAGTSLELSYVASAYVRQETPTPGLPPADLPR